MSTLNVTNIKAADGTSGLSIANTTGIITATKGVNSVAFRVDASNLDQTITNGKLEWENVTLDTGSYWDSTNHRYTPGVAGWYLFGGVVRVATSSAGDGSPHNLMILDLQKNGTSHVRSQLQTNSDIIINGSYPIPTGMIQLNGSGDYVEVHISTDETLVAHDHATVISEFWGMLVQAT